MAGVAAIALEGPKAVGKTETASRRATTIFRLDDAAQHSIVRADPSRLVAGPPPTLVDEWPRFPSSWELVRRAVDADRTPGRFLLTGSADPDIPALHSGAGRIVSVRMRPMTLAERGIGIPTVSLAALLAGDGEIGGRTDIRLEQYVDEILASGFPGFRGLPARAVRAELDGYVARIIQKDFAQMGRPIRHAAALRAWLTAYAAATSTTAAAETIRTAAGEAGPSRPTVTPYDQILRNLWIVDPIAPWFPARKSPLSRLVGREKHHLADPGLAARLLGATAPALLAGREVGPPIPRTGTLLGSLFESLAALSIRVFAQSAEGKVFHYRTRAGEREIDFIIEGPDLRVLPVEVKLAEVIEDRDVRHLKALRDDLPDDVVDMVILTTGSEAYRRKDGVAVVPLALLGP
ncbi:MAG: ATP-binding protein [Chloroflexi bacterium]|nr:ATP-binding protein [Chloroflexota bacterium]